MAASIHSGHRERIRAQYAQTGGEGFLDYQYLELLLTYAVPRRDTNELAHRLLLCFGTLENLFHADIHELTRVDGIGESTAIFLRMQGDLLKRITFDRLRDARGQIVLNTPFAAANYAYALLRGRSNETVQIVCLNSKRVVIHTEILQTGTPTEARIYPRSIAEAALLHHAHSIILIHNHPSGDPTPSPDDGETTEAVRNAISGIGIQLADHLVVGDFFVYSFSADVMLDLAAEPPVTLSPADYASYRSCPSAERRKVMESYDIP